MNQNATFNQSECSICDNYSLKVVSNKSTIKAKRVSQAQKSKNIRIPFTMLLSMNRQRW